MTVNSLKNLKIGPKLIAAFLIVSIVPIVLKKSENLRGRLFGERQLRRGYHLNAGCALLRASYEEKWVGRLSPQPKFLIVDSRR